MTNKELEEKLKQLKIEDYIWLVYLGIIISSWYSNYLERKYYKYNDFYSKDKYLHINQIIFGILLIVYIYFLNSSYKDFKNLKEIDSKKKKDLVTLSFIGAILITVSGIIFFYITLKNDDLDVEIAFN